MKLNGMRLGGVYSKVVAFPRGDSEIAFTVQAVHDYSDFDKLCPEPEPTKFKRPDGSTGEAADTEEYQAKRRSWLELRMRWMMIRSIMATPGLEFEQVKFARPDTWTLVYEELGTCGLAPAEVRQIFDAVLEVNGMNSAAIEEARQRFLRRLAAPPQG